LFFNTLEKFLFIFLEKINLKLTMARYLGPRLRVVRRFGNLPGLTAKVPKKKAPPGQHGPNQKKQQKSSSISDYKIRLFEKQKLRYNYGLSERQLQRYVREARQKKGSTGFFLMQLLEMRVDTIVFRLGLAPTIPAARQFVSHGHLLINNKKITIPSFQCRPGDSITIKNKKGSKTIVEKSLTNPRFSSLPAHLEFNSKSLQAEVKDLVSKKDLSFKVNELLIVEYYSRIG
jgi:small subunit ribosomal protein S4